MSLLQWRRFTFFDKELVKKEDSSEPFESFKDAIWTAWTNDRGRIVLGDSDGYVYMFDHHYKPNIFRAYESQIDCLFHSKLHNLLISIGNESENMSPLLKVWNLDKMDLNLVPSCCKIIRIALTGNFSKVASLCVHENLNLIAVGFENGKVILYTGDVMRNKQDKEQILHEGTSPISGLFFRTTPQNQVLYITTQSEVIRVYIMAKQKDQKLVLDYHGCMKNCCVLSDSSQHCQLVIGRPDAVYLYNDEGRGPCLAFESEKLQVHWYRAYLVVVSRESKSLIRNSSENSLGGEMHLVTAYDLHNKFVAYSGLFPKVVTIFAEWGSLFVLTHDYKLHQIIEKDTQAKLDILFKKNLFDLGISLAQSCQYNAEAMTNIFKQYGDHLYNKGDHDGAMVQYIKTIGKLESSYVIRKFLDGSRIHNLTSYMQMLHKKRLTTEDHTTLLLNCYTKLKDEANLDRFISNEELELDVESTIRICKTSGYAKQALQLATKHHKDDWVFKLLLEDSKSNDYCAALDYMNTLTPKQAKFYLKKFGKSLMTQLPGETTALVKKVCLDLSLNAPPPDSTSEGGLDNKCNPEDFVHIFVDNPTNLIQFLEDMSKTDIKLSGSACNTLLELYLNQYYMDPTDKESKKQKIISLLKDPQMTYDLDQILILCQLNDFKEGLLYLYQKAKYYQQIIQYHMDSDNYDDVIQTCKEFGNRDESLWTQALVYFAKSDSLKSKNAIAKVLTYVEKNKLLPPLLVLQTLSHNPGITLANLKDYIINCLEHEEEGMEENERIVNKYRTQTDLMRKDLEQKQTCAQIFQNQKCSVCSHALDLPSVHFLCQHSFHQHCFESYAENDTDCPICLPDQRAIKVASGSRSRGQGQSQGQSTTTVVGGVSSMDRKFEEDLNSAARPFDVIADYYSLGLFQKNLLNTS